ncbi:MAG: NUDIX hydrolase, partial [Actinomycetaceae bacterium]|nr:NUDIX hydrolase [Actinomycetaceae bacterium]
DAVAILPIRMGDNGDEEVLLIRQYRHPIRHIMWEIPAGLLDVEGETAELAAHRELGEEVDMVAGSLEPLINMYATTGCSDEQYMIFIARDVHASDVVFDRQDEEAEIESFWVPLSRVCQAIYAGDLRSPTLVTAILAYIGKQSVFLNGSK